MAVSTLVPIPHVRVLWRPEQFTRIDNPGFETNTSGWAVTAGINAAATSITRITSDSHTGSASAQLVTTATAGSGVNFDLGTDRYYAEADYGTMYAAVVWLKRVSGPRICKLVLGSLGTSSDRDEAIITDLADDWRPYRVMWAPRGDRTDAELALVTITGEVLTVDIDDASLYQTECFSQVENGTFPVDTTGWKKNTGVVLTRLSATPYVTGGAYLRVDTTGGSGGSDAVWFDMGSRLFTSGRTYRARVAARLISGAASRKLTLGEVGVDSIGASVTLTADWQIFTQDWTPGADRTGVDVRMDEFGQGSGVWEIANIEAYEKSDELGTDLETFDFRQGANFDGRSETPGSFTLTLGDDAGKYSPRNTSGALYGSLEPGKAVLGRADFSNQGYPLFAGDIATIEPEPLSAKVTITGDDPLASSGRVPIRQDFSAEKSYKDARAHAFGQVLSRGQRRDRADLFGGSRLDLSDKSTEGNTFYDFTDREQPLKSYLAALNAATGTLHRIVPSYDANKPWAYTTTDRATLTDTDAGTTIDEDFAAITNYRTGAEALENRQQVSWQAYAEIPLPTDVNFGAAYTWVALAGDPTQQAAYKGDIDTVGPYLHFTDARIGSGSTPDPEVTEGGLIITGFSFDRGRNGRRHLRLRRRIGDAILVYPDAFVPFTMIVGEDDERIVEFSIPVAEPSVQMFEGTAPSEVYVETLDDPRRLAIRWWATVGEQTISGLTAASVTTTGATITWSVAPPATGRVEYADNVGLVGSSLTTLETNELGFHSQAITGLTPGTPYWYRVVESTSDGSTIQSAVQTFTTINPGLMLMLQLPGA